MLRPAATAAVRRVWLTQTARSGPVVSNLGRHETPLPWVGCSHWTGPHRPSRGCSNRPASGDKGDDHLADSKNEESSLTIELDKESVGWEETDLDHIEEDQHGDLSAISQDGITIDKVEPAKLNRPALPTSIKKLNRLLSHDRQIPIPASDLIERFVKGRGPGGQAINKTNSSVSLTHIPTGIRIQSQPTRSREENRKIARKILAEKLDLLRAHEAARQRKPEHEGGGEGVSIGGRREGEGTGKGEDSAGKEAKKTKKEKEKGMAGVWSRDEIRWEKERRRKVNKAKKTKKKRKEAASEDGDE